MKNLHGHLKSVPSTYRELVAMHPPRPIHTDAQCAVASKILEKMIGHSLNADQEDYMDLLASLVAEYDDKRHPMNLRKMSPLEALKYVMEESGMTASDVGRLLGNRELGSKILREERGMSLAHIAKLAEHFAVRPELFLPASTAIKPRKNLKKDSKWRSGTTMKMNNAKR